MTKNDSMQTALKTVIARVNVHGQRAVRASEVRAAGWPRSNAREWARQVSAAGIRTLECAGETWLVVS